MEYNCSSHSEELTHSADQASLCDKNFPIQISVSTSTYSRITLHQHLPSTMEHSANPSIRTTVTNLRNAARARRGPLPSSGDTFLISQQSGETELSTDRHQSPAVPPSPSQSEHNGDIHGTSQQKKRRTGPREIVDSEHLCTLVAAYNVHFEKYSVGKTNVTQVIPSHVWKNTYATYKENHPESVFRQESLKDRLRDTLKELKTGNNNAENAKTAALQSNQVMAALRCTDGHAKRNVLKKRAEILQNTGKDFEGSSEGSGDSDSSPHDSPPMQARGKGPAMPETLRQPKGKENAPITKAHMLQKQSSAIERICHTYERSATKRDVLVDLKIVSNEAKHTKHKIDNLKTARDLGVITDVEFKDRVKELLQLSNE